MSGGEQFGDVVGEAAYVVEGRPAVEGHDDVEAARAGRHHERRQVELVEQLVQAQCGRADQGEVVARRIEVEHEPVRMVRPVRLRQETVRVTHAWSAR